MRNCIKKNTKNLRRANRMSKISGDLIREIESRTDSKQLQEIAVELLDLIGNDSSDEQLKTSIARKVDRVVREEEK